MSEYKIDKNIPLPGPSPRAPVYTLDELLAGITEENLHGETFAASPVGNEIL